MTNSTALRIAFRESRASSTKFLFVIAAVAIGIGSINGVRGFSRAFRTMLLSEARTLMAADLSVRVFEQPTPDQQKAFDNYQSRGVRRTQITETVSMMASTAVPEPVLVSVKAVDPTRYPFYGEVKLSTGVPLAQALTPDAVAVSDDLLPRLNVSVGQTVRLAGADFRLAAIVSSEPDRMTGSLNVGPRVMISRQGLKRTSLMQEGSRAAQRHIFKLPPQGIDVSTMRADMVKLFPNAIVADFRETHPLVTRGLDQATTFLSLISLIALIVGGLGVATAMQSHINQKLDSIAIMKSIGGRSGQIIKIYVLQTALLAITGGVLGIFIGFGVQAVFPMVLSRLFPITAKIQFDPLSIVESLILALLTTLLFTLPTLLSVRSVPPGLILRREMSESRPRPTRLASVAASLLLTLGIAGMALWLAGGKLMDALKISGYFTGGLIGSMLILFALAWLLLRSLRTTFRAKLLGFPSTIRQGVANLYRPGSNAQTILVVLGVGVMFTLTIYLLQHSMLQQIAASAPPGMPNVFMINITERERTGIEQIVRSTPGVTGPFELTPAVAARLTAINGTPLDQLPQQGPMRRFRQTRTVTYSANIPPDTRIIKGAWWTAAASPNQVSVAENTAQFLKLAPGSTVDWTAAGRNFSATVVAIHRTESVRPGSTIDFLFSPGTLSGLPVLYFGGVRVPPKSVPGLQRKAFERSPSVTMVNVADVLDRIQEVVDQIAIVVRFISGFSILAGIVILASSVAGTRFRRIREVVILKTLGATRNRIAAIFSVEFLVLGLTAGITGCILANVFSSLVLEEFLNARYTFSVLPNVIAILGTALLANVAGWLASYSIIGQKPLEILRQE